MTEDKHIKIVAMLQHFYDLMDADRKEVDDRLIHTPTNVFDIGRQDAIEKFIKQYEEIFSEVLYVE